MNVSKTLREYIESTVNRKVTEKVRQKNDEQDRIFEKIRPKLDKLYCEHVEKARKIISDAGLNPDEYGYRESSPAVAPGYTFRYRGIRGSYIHRNVQDILIRLELDEIPKNEVKSFIDNYEVDISDDKSDY